jgi:putative transposase
MGNHQAIPSRSERIWTSPDCKFTRDFECDFYVHRSGCQWEMLPHDLPPHTTVYKYFQKWERKKIWKQIHDQLRHKLRKHQGRAEQSTVAIADSQSVETTEKRGRSMALTAANSSKVANGI